jgi:NAD(P)H dehydrogenase (quinone)
MAAAVLHQGPEKHHGRDYWMSTDVLDGFEVSAILSEVTGRNITFTHQTPDDFKALVSSPNSPAEPWYVEGGTEFMLYWDHSRRYSLRAWKACIDLPRMG